jgi:hypothetical protein
MKNDTPAFCPRCRAVILPAGWSGSQPLPEFGYYPSGASRNPEYLSSAGPPVSRSAGFQTCCVADFQVGTGALRPAGLETRDTADLEVCATLKRYNPEGIASVQPKPL